MVNIHIIEKSADCRYMTLAETLLSNAERHWLRAQHWLAVGAPDYAMNSLRKAARNEDRARRLQWL